MKSFIIFATILLTLSCSALPYGAVSSQYQSLDPHGSYSYGYADPNSQKHESRSHDGTTHGGYSYVDGHGHIQSVSYVADPHTGFHVTGTNLPKGPEPVNHHHAVATYHHVAPAAHHIYAAPYGHHEVALTHAGVPVDTPEVQHAKAAHFAAHAQAAHGAHGHYNGAPVDTPEVAHAKAAHFAAHAAAGHHLHKRSLWGGHGYGHSAPWGGYHVPVIHNGVPVETPEVQHAKAAHFAAHAQAGGHGHYNGAPAETPEVAHAKAAHFAAHAAARSGHAVAPAHHGAYHVPVIHNGVPVDTPEVQHAKAAHFAAVAEAAASGAHYGGGHDDGQYHHGHDDGHYQGHDDGHFYGDSGAHHAGHHGPIHIPVIHNGVPVETPEVQHAKAAHFAAVAEAHSRGGHDYTGHHGDGHYDDGHYNQHHNQW